MKRLLVASLVLMGVCANAWAQPSTPAKRPRPNITLDVKDTPLSEVLVKAARDARFSFILDPAAQVKGKPASEVRVTGTFDDVNVWDFLDDILVRRRLRRMTVDDVLLISHKPRQPMLIYESIPEEAVRGLGRRVALFAQDEPVRNVTQRAAKAAGFKVRFDLHADPAPKQPNVTCAIHDMSVIAWLDWAASFEGLTWRVDGKTVVMTDQLRKEDVETLGKLRKKVVTFWLADQPVTSVVHYFQKQAKVDIVSNPSSLTHTPKTITLNMTDVTVEDGLHALVHKIRLQQGIWQGMVVVTDEKGARWFRTVEKSSILGRPEPTAADRTTVRKLHETIVSFHFSEQPYRDAIQFLGTVGNVDIVLAKTALKDPAQTLSLVMTDVPLERALQAICWQMGWRCALINGKLHLTNADGLKHLEKRTGAALVPMPEPKQEKKRKKLGETTVGF